MLLGLLAVHASAQAPRRLVDEGRAALQRGDVHDAVKLLEEAVADNPQNAQAHYWLGIAYGREAEEASILRRFTLAKKTRQEFERAVQLDPDSIDARFALVEFYTLAPGFLGGSTAKAYTEAAEIAARNPDKGRVALAFVASRGSWGTLQGADVPPRQQTAHTRPKR